MKKNIIIYFVMMLLISSTILSNAGNIKTDLTKKQHLIPNKFDSSSIPPSINAYYDAVEISYDSNKFVIAVGCTEDNNGLADFRITKLDLQNRKLLKDEVFGYNLFNEVFYSVDKTQICLEEAPPDIVCAGLKQSTLAYPGNAYCAKYDIDLNLVIDWKSGHFPSIYDEARSIVVIDYYDFFFPDTIIETYILAGNLTNPISLKDEGCTIRLDRNLNFLWEIDFPLASNFYSISGVTDNAPAYIYAGKTVAGNDIILVKEWQNVWDWMHPRNSKSFIHHIDGYNSCATSVQETDEGWFVLTANKEKITNGIKEGLLCKLTEDLDELLILANHRVYWPECEDAEFFSVQQTSDGCFIIGGYGRRPDYGDLDMWFIKTDTDGNSILNKHFDPSHGGDDIAYSVIETSSPNEGYLLVGTEIKEYISPMNFSTGSSDISRGLLLKLDENGETEWVGIFGPEENTVLSIQSIDGGFGVSAVIENAGNTDATNIEGEIIIDAPLIFMGQSTPIMVSVPAGETSTFNSNFVVGFGQATITLNVGGLTKKASCFLFGPFVLYVEEI